MVLEITELVLQRKKELRETQSRANQLLQEIRHLEAAEAARRGVVRGTNGRRQTSLEMAEVTLKDEKAALPTAEIVDRIREKFGMHVNPNSLANMLRRAATERKWKFFKDRKRPNAYGLLEWGQR